MPPPSEALQRYDIIDRCLTNRYGNFPTMAQIKRAIDHELNCDVSKETIQKDIAKMKAPLEEGGYGAPIKFKKSVNGYYYDLETFPDYTIRQFGLNQKSLEQIEIAAGVLQRFKGVMSSDSFNQTLNHLYASLNIERSSSEKKLSNAILPKDTTYLRGMENFDLMCEAIKRKLPINFIHYSYQSEIFKTVVIHPYLLKESNDRWYLVGYSEDHHEIRYFGIDRIYDPVLISKPFIENDTVNLNEIFANKIGLKTISYQKKFKTEKISIWVEKSIVSYFKSMPIHRSQEIEETDGDGDIVIKLNLVPTDELVSLILSYGKRVVLLEPLWLRKVIQTELESSTSNYK